MEKKAQKDRVRTTLYLETNLKKLAEIQAVRENVTLQTIFNRALKTELTKTIPTKKKKFKFADLKLDLPTHIPRSFYYDL